MSEESVFYKRLKGIVKQSGKSVNQIERELGYSRNALNNYKNIIEPSGSRLLKLARYFKVSPEFLIGEAEAPSQTNIEIIFKSLNEKQKLEMLKFCQNWVENIIKNTQFSDK
ncbi:helix-turn-helix domain-containing protein [Lactococcus lactis]|uniref:Helix-turn-helix domain-containing protein n=1 Tax=Lactococcus lactis TaxID=1358 RepID=A0A9X4S5Q7_9LACT|nr:helix-turn-helix transcriptional regulator [Lactococcus lactis]MDG4984968.1 helix-turn-helix domain-containing protein [Lactococcus lactis]